MLKSHVLLLVGAFALLVAPLAIGQELEPAGDALGGAGDEKPAVAADNPAEATKDQVEAAEKDVDAAKDEAEKAADVEQVEATKGDAEVAEPVVAAEEEQAEDENGKSIGHILLMYIPNLFMDLGDIFSLSLGVGSEAGVEARITRWFQVGGMYGQDYFVEKAYNRTYGGGYSDGYDFALGALQSEVRVVDPTIGKTPLCILKNKNAKVQRPSDELYKNKNRDFWGVGFDAGWLILVGFELHPVEIADFITGIFAYDLTGDNF